MEKVILILNGVSSSKTKFIEIVKENGFWTWNLNSRNVLGLVSYKVGWSGDRSKSYYEFIEQFESLVDKYFDFENWYFSSMIKKFLANDKATLLIIHNCKENLAKKLKEEHANCFSINVLDQDADPLPKDEQYFAILNSRDEKYSEKILRILEELSIEKEEQNGT
jgi:Zn-dependent M16 (insulinase) family peptidase